MLVLAAGRLRTSALSGGHLRRVLRLAAAHHYHLIALPLLSLFLLLLLSGVQHALHILRVRKFRLEFIVELTFKHFLDDFRQSIPDFLALFNQILGDFIIGDVFSYFYDVECIDGFK
jgi:hypothetical protein